MRQAEERPLLVSARPTRHTSRRVAVRAAARLTPWLVGCVVVLVLVYMVVSHRQRRTLLMDAVVQKTDLLSAVIAFAADDLLRQGRTVELDRLLDSALEAEDIFAAFVLGPAGGVVAGDALDMSCLRSNLPSQLSAARSMGDAHCGAGVHWTAMALNSQPGWLVVAVQEVLLRSAVNDAIQRQLILLVALAATVGAALTIVLRLQRRLDRTEKFAMVGRLSGGLAHELGSPLSVIGMRASAIADQVPPEHEAFRHARAITREVARVTAFIHGLLHLSRRQGVELARVDLCSILDAAIADVAGAAGATRVEIAVSTPAEPAFVLGDEALLLHAARNVLRNAIQALRDQPEPRHLSVDVNAQPRTVTATIEDNGPGIPLDQIAHIFDPFFTTKTDVEGMGLGLPITRGIILEHGGSIRVDNRADGGARVTIRLPRAAGDRADSEAAEPGRN